jgi:hypothetical protein
MAGLAPLDIRGCCLDWGHYKQRFLENSRHSDFHVSDR